MGSTKRYLMEQEERGFKSFGVKYACDECIYDLCIFEEVNNTGIHTFIQKHATKEKCDYCGREEEKPIAALLDDIVEHILNSVSIEWDHPYNTGNTVEDGQWVFGEPYDIYDLIDHFEICIEDQTLNEEVVDALSDYQWNEKHLLSGSEEDHLMFSWEDFAKQVKYKTRYVFFRIGIQPDEDTKFGEIPPAKMLDQLNEIFRDPKLELVETLEIGTKFFRARMPDPDREFTNAAELGPPPADKAKKPNRMSPAGIPMFYGAFDENTAITETIDTHEDQIAAVGTFSTLKRIRVLNLNLAKLPNVPSIFDPEKCSQRSSIAFLRAFAEEISKSIKGDDQHIDYVPTQILCEYLRHLFEDIDGNRIDGILYHSAKGEGTCCALFFIQEDCCDSYSPDKSLLLESYSHYQITTHSKENSIYATWQKT